MRGSELASRAPLGVALWLVACVPLEHQTAVTRFKLDFNCDSGEVTRSAGNTLRVEGCRRWAQYTCLNRTCTREYSDGELRELSGTTVVAPRPASASYGAVQRTYDERQAMHFVRAKLWMGGVNELYLAGAPKQALTTVHVQLVVRTVPARFLGYCQMLRLRINDRPFDARDVRIENTTGGRLVRVSGKFELEVFRPLSQPYATMSVESCGRAVATVPEHMPKLLEFFEIYSQIAMEVQAENPNATSPASGEGAISL